MGKQETEARQRPVQRRDLIAALGAAVGWPGLARAQQPATRKIGFLSPFTRAASARSLDVMRKGLADIGFVEGRNLTIEARWAEGHPEKIPALAAELVALRVDAIMTGGGTPTVLATKAATDTIPIIFTIGGDPVHIGLVKSLNRPGGNLTGTTIIDTELRSKQFDLLHELVPSEIDAGLLTDPNNPAGLQSLDAAAAAAKSFGWTLTYFKPAGPGEFGSVFGAIKDRGIGGLVVTSAPLFLSHAVEIAELGGRLAIPIVYPSRDFAAAGVTASYGADANEAWRISIRLAGKILAGANPADMPVEQATKFELVINLKTVKSLGLMIPSTLLARADEVIE